MIPLLQLYTLSKCQNIIIGQSTSINVFSWLLFFLKLREREWYTKFGCVKEKRPQSYLSYFSMMFHWRIFLLSRANRLYSIFYTGLKNLGSFVIRYYFVFNLEYWLWFVCPLQTLLKNSLSYYLLPLRGRGPHFRFEVPANHLASLFSPLVSGNLRLLSTNTCWYPSVTYILP